MENISDILLSWFAREGRDLPWRRTRDPYRIWLSEVILQQTRVAQGLQYYLRFTERFPDIAALAAAPEDEVLKLWQGLGYYSRARNLHAAARQVVSRFGGVFPATYGEVRALRGVGDYTAAAVCSIVYDAPCAVVDGNVYRVLARLFDIGIPIDTTAGKRAFAELAQSQLDTSRPGLYNQAIMDFGALQCTPAQPRCGDCPLAGRCLALAAGTVGVRPVKQGRGKMRDRWFNYLHVTCGGQTLLHRRGGGDIWGCMNFRLSKRTRLRISRSWLQRRRSANCSATAGGTCGAASRCPGTSFRTSFCMRFSTASNATPCLLSRPWKPPRWAAMPCRGWSTVT